MAGKGRLRVRRGSPVRHAPRAILALMLREMATTYGRSPGGYLWAVIEPAAGVALLTVVFSIGFRAPPLGVSFPLFYATGVLPFLMFTDVANKIGQTVQFSQALLRYPRVTFLDAILARLFLNGGVQMMAGVIVLAFIVLGLGARASVDFAALGAAALLALGLAAGIGTLNAFLSLAWPLWTTIWAIATRPLFIVSCIFFLYRSVPQPWDGLLWFNPLVHVTGLMRQGVYPFYRPDYVSPLYVAGVAAACFISGLFLLWRHHRDILHR
ncbi:sugar ABC transporter permease [Roseovarius spongiae]|uniref:Sugar ABC transporter permease n=1 Tax=Roseovarius spongiae TaxID=2320272 RepID=A0A3A8B4L8_9RHOB|nr:ABC transporter permease [Roseovarius spongiae]RKF13477.1 sugar ABC transporter permease [Roseovarius spongiae]